MTGGSAVFTPRVDYVGGPAGGDLAAALGLPDLKNLSASRMWATQPHFRTVVTFVARNTAQLGLHSFVRSGDSRERDRSSTLARSLATVDGTMTPFELIFALVGDLMLYDRAYWWVAPSSDFDHGFMIRRLPPTWVEPVMSDPWTASHYKVWRGAGSPVKVPTEHILAFPGYHPGKTSGSSPIVDALRDTLQEQIEAAVYRAQVWKRGGRVSAVLQRPKDAPAWSDEARTQFREDWYAKFTGRGSRAGGTPILEDGMTLNRIDFNAQEQQFVEAAKLSLVTVASAFHVNPTMIGQNDGANYSNVREFRKMLYGETLGPLIAQIEDRINTFLVPMLGLDPAIHYVEFNIQEKLQGNFEEQAAVISTSVGRPWMTADEARARFNMPALGGDAAGLVTPLNVLTGGQASPRDSGSQNLNAAPAPRFKARAKDTSDTKHEQVLAEFFARQGRAVRGALGQKDGRDWWDAEKWDGELTDTLLALAVSTSKQVGEATAERLGFDPDEYDVDRTIEFLRAVSEREASDINATTRDQIDAALEDDDPDAAVANVFEVAVGARAAQAATTLVTQASGFGSTEAGSQLSGGTATKTWVVTSSNPRASHAAMNGETVGIDEDFSNGMKWPASGGDPAEVAGCRCEVSIEIP